MDSIFCHRPNGRNGDRVQCDGATPGGSTHTIGLTGVSDALRNVHIVAHKMGSGEDLHSPRSVVHGRRWISGDGK